MRIGVLVGKRADGQVDYLGNPGNVDELDKLQRQITDKGGLKAGKSFVKYVKTWLADASANPLKAKKCG